jgi:hypothetical protein
VALEPPLVDLRQAWVRRKQKSGVRPPNSAPIPLRYIRYSVLGRFLLLCDGRGPRHHLLLEPWMLSSVELDFRL